MENWVLMVGTLLALSFGFALLAGIIKITISNSRPTPQPENLNLTELSQEPVDSDMGQLAWAVRGYDSPEIYRDDTVARLRHSRQEQHLH
jgi:hypothetical protein